MNAQIYLCRKQSGNYIVSSHTSPAWVVVEKCETPKQLFDAVEKLHPISRFCKIILSEYSQAQLKCSPIEFTRERALRAFEIAVTKVNVSTYFPEIRF